MNGFVPEEPLTEAECQDIVELCEELEKEDTRSAQEFYGAMTVEEGGPFCCANLAAQWSDCTRPGCCDDPEECECFDQCDCCSDTGGRCVVKKMNRTEQLEFLREKIKTTKRKIVQCEEREAKRQRC